MRLPADVRRRGSPRARTRLWLLLAATGAGLSLHGQAARASVDDNWATVEINRGLAERTREAGERSRYRGAIERNAEDDEARPQRSAPLKRRSAHRFRRGPQVASLAPTPALDPARQSATAETPRPQSKAPRNPLGAMVASLGREFMVPTPKELPSLFGGPIRWVASADCLVKPLQGVLAEVAAIFGPLQVNSTCRSPRHNRRVGGARRSQHLTGSAVDFRIASNAKAVLSFLKAQKVVGGYKHYGRGVFHIDTGPRRTW